MATCGTGTSSCAISAAMSRPPRHVADDERVGRGVGHDAPALRVPSPRRCGEVADRDVVDAERLRDQRLGGGPRCQPLDLVHADDPAGQLLRGQAVRLEEGAQRQVPRLVAELDAVDDGSAPTPVPPMIERPENSAKVASTSRISVSRSSP
jgi:hypothetical protein